MEMPPIVEEVPGMSGYTFLCFSAQVAAKPGKLLKKGRRFQA